MEPMQKISGVGAGGKEEREELGAVAVAEALIKSSCKATYSWAFQIHEAIIFSLKVNLGWLFLKLCT